MKSIYSYLVALVCLAACSDVQTGEQKVSESGVATYTYSTAPKEDTVKVASIDTLKIDGTYTGLLPCASCAGIETSITLYPDQSFLMKEIYKGEQPDSFINKGKYEVKDSKLYIKMEGAGVERPVIYSMSPNSLTQLDMQGNAIKGTMADHYRLIKK